MRSVDDLEIRPITDDEFNDWGRTIERAFGEDPSDEALARWRTIYGDDLSRTMAAFDGDRIVGTNADFDLDMSVPGGEPVPCAGVTAVSVATDWRRRGLLRRMMRAQLERVHDLGEPFAALYASESPIYRRFGYGIAAPHCHYRIARHHAAIEHTPDVSQVRLVDAQTALEAYPAIYEQVRELRGGMMRRNERWWRAVLEHDVPDDRGGYGPRNLALLPGRGYAYYRVKSDWDMQGAKGTLQVDQLAAVDTEAELALWQFVFGVDLVGEIVAYMQPVDGPLPLRLTYRGRLAENLREGLWLRLVDVGAALATRAYDHDDRLVLEVRDDFCSWNAGRWSLEVLEGKAGCEETTAEPDLALDVSDLASLILGGLSPHQLARAGRIEEFSSGALTRARRMFAVDLAPWNPFEF